MSQLTLTHVLQRSAAARGLRWGTGDLPDHQERLLMRLTGFTPLARLSDPAHDAQWLLGVAEELIETGLAEVVEVADDLTDLDSTWGELALAMAH